MGHADVRNLNRQGKGNSAWTPEQREILIKALIQEAENGVILDLQDLSGKLGRTVKTLKDRAVKVRAELRDEGII